MRASIFQTAFLAATATAGQTSTLDEVCTSAFATSALPADNFIDGTTINTASVVVTAVTNSSITGNNMYPDATIDYCAIKFSYSHTGINDTTTVMYWMPSPADFQNRFLTTGGGGFLINSGNGSLPGGIIYGAAAGITDGGFGGFNTQLTGVFPTANGTSNRDALYMFGYQAIHEMTLLGQQFTKQFFGMNSTKLYSYYQACSEGGREGWSQAQRFGSQFDGIITGAPALRFGFQQVNHLAGNLVEKTLGYYPPSCEFDAIVNATIAACDPLDGRSDGVVARSDLCKLQFNSTALIGTPYSCAAQGATGGGAGGSPGARKQMPQAASVPAQYGNISAEGIAITQEILKGLHNSKGEQVYIPYQPAATFADAATAYNATTGTWGLSISGIGAQWVQRFLNLQETDTLESLDNVTYDTLQQWMIRGWQTYSDVLETTWPDLTPFYEAGGKILHYHGESDNSIPAASSVRYHESVRSIMYSNMTFNESTTALGDWYRLFLVPGAAHCSSNTLQPNGPFPRTNLAVLIDWVEKDVVPTTLNATVLSGANTGDEQQICAWPLRPYWRNNGTTMECQYDQASIDSWIYDLDAIKLPVY